MSALYELLEYAVQRQASDIHLTVGQKPVLRVRGELDWVDTEALGPDEMYRIVDDVLRPNDLEAFKRGNEVDFALSEKGVGRFRTNVFMSRGSPAIAMRHVKTQIPEFEELNLPEQLKKIAEYPRGIVLVSGSTGSGKSTSLAAMLQHINRTRRCRIVTIEDPIEYLFRDDLAVISQREIGLDTSSFRSALKYVLRQDPDVILVGEMRDKESFQAALSAAETGHLVFSTLHTASAGQAISRILDFFPADEREQMRMAIAGNMQSIIAQRLIPSTSGGVVPAIEIMINTSTIRKLIQDNKLEILPTAIETGKADGMQSFNEAIYQLIITGKITETHGMATATNPEALTMKLKGINLGEDNRIIG